MRKQKITLTVTKEETGFSAIASIGKNFIQIIPRSSASAVRAESLKTKSFHKTINGLSATNTPIALLRGHLLQPRANLRRIKINGIRSRQSNLSGQRHNL